MGANSFARGATWTGVGRRNSPLGKASRPNEPGLAARLMSPATSTQSWATRSRQRLWRLAPADRGPIVLRHHRIYILPTRRGLALIATLAIMLLTSMNYSLSLGHALTFLVAGLVAAALLQTYRNLVGIAASPLAAGGAFSRGEPPVTPAPAQSGAPP